MGDIRSSSSPTNPSQKMTSCQDTVGVAEPIGYKTPRAARNRLPKSNVAIKPRLPDYAQSCAANWVPLTPATPESAALESFKNEWKNNQDTVIDYENYSHQKEVLLIDLNGYELYASQAGKLRDYELASLHHLDVKGIDLSFDGVLSLRGIKYYVEDISIKDYSIEGYGDAEDAEATIYIQSTDASMDSMFDIWYRLRKPAARYKHFHETFQWIATLGKHVVDYMEAQQGSVLGLKDFRSDFYTFVTSRFRRNGRFKAWLKDFGRTDFRVAVHANIDYLLHQACNLPNRKELLLHPLWSDCMKGDTLKIKKQPIRSHKTTTTPMVYQCFKGTYFGGELQEVYPVQATREQRESRMRKLGFASDSPTQQGFKKATAVSKTQLIPLKVGDVVAISPDNHEKQRWKSQDRNWLAYIQRIEPVGDEVQRLFVIWLYHPRDTTILNAEYPIENEIFFSDNCNCDDSQLLSTDVCGRISVDWNPSSLKTSSDYIIRQTYITQNCSFVSLKSGHFRCSCEKPIQPQAIKWNTGATFYITKLRSCRTILEPVVIEDIDPLSNKVIVRQLLRLKRDLAGIVSLGRKQNIPENELVWTDTLISVPRTRIQRNCHIRFITQEDAITGDIPFPYDRRGNGDFWTISTRLVESDSKHINYLTKAPPHLEQGPIISLSSPLENLPGLSIFSGGGNFDRGLEEGGAVKFTTAVDIDPAAMHTQRANAQDPEGLKLYCGSVDDYLKAVITAKDEPMIARIGEIAVVTAGSPCPGFSTMQQNILSAASLRNASHITTFCSSVDIYRPLFGILENVVNMASTRTGLEDQNVLSQVVACLVALGYQVKQFITDAWSVGSVQRRSRLFITITAPGLESMIEPFHTHCHPRGTETRGLGKLANGNRFGVRKFIPTPFEHITAGQATSDLPDIGNGNVQTCIQFPDHRLAWAMNRNDRALIERIPTCPPGSGYAEAFELGLLPSSVQKRKKEIGRAFRRIKKDGLIPTITTGISPQNARGGAVIHWKEPRPITIQEARRVQGVRDEEPIIGSLADQWRIIGNAVDRQVAFALGLSLRRAVEKNRRILTSIDAFSQP